MPDTVTFLGPSEIDRAWIDKDGYTWQYWETENVEGWFGIKPGADYVRIAAVSGYGPYVEVTNA